VSEANCSADYFKYAIAVAETRAKGRAFRAALRLKKVIAAEEVDRSIETPGETDNGPIRSGQVSIIQIMADRLNISVPKLLADLELGKGDVNQLTKTEGMLVVRHLNVLQQTGHVPQKLERM
jgi:hypothetical protein